MKRLILVHYLAIIASLFFIVNLQLFAIDNNKKIRAEDYYQKALAYYEKDEIF